MTEPQFIHIEAYGRAASRGKGGKGRGKANLLGVAQEASRKPSASRHVPKPRKPITILGEAPMLVVERMIQEADDAVITVRKRGPRSGSGSSADTGLRADIEQGSAPDTGAVSGTETRRLRQDALLMVVGVASFPKALKDQDGELYDRWLELTQSYLQDRYGEHLVSIVEHLDEAHPHIHFFLKPNRLADGTYNIGALHPGIKARKQAQASGLSPFVAYQAAMGEFQRNYFEAVGEAIGLVQKSIQRVRVTRYLALTMRADLELKETGSLDLSTRAGIDKQICQQRWDAYQKNIWKQTQHEPLEAWKNREQLERQRVLNWHEPDPKGFIPASDTDAPAALGRLIEQRDQRLATKDEPALSLSPAGPSPKVNSDSSPLSLSPPKKPAPQALDPMPLMPTSKSPPALVRQAEWLEKAAKRAQALAEIVTARVETGHFPLMPTEEEIESHIASSEWVQSLKPPEP